MKELEQEVTQVGNNLRSLEISEGKATEREESYECKIADLTQQLEDVSTKPSYDILGGGKSLRTVSFSLLHHLSGNCVTVVSFILLSLTCYHLCALNIPQILFGFKYIYFSRVHTPPGKPGNP